MAIAMQRRLLSAQPIAAGELRRVFGAKKGSVVTLDRRSSRRGARAIGSILVERDQVFGTPDIYARLFGCTTTVVPAAGPVRISPELMDRLRRDAEIQRTRMMRDAFAWLGKWLRRRRPDPKIAPRPCG